MTHAAAYALALSSGIMPARLSMADHGDFLAAINATPHDPVRRLAYADFLDERGQPDTAAAVRHDAAPHDHPAPTKGSLPWGVPPLALYTLDPAARHVAHDPDGPIDWFHAAHTYPNRPTTAVRLSPELDGFLRLWSAEMTPYWRRHGEWDPASESYPNNRHVTVPDDSPDPVAWFAAHHLGHTRHALTDEANRLAGTRPLVNVFHGPVPVVGGRRKSEVTLFPGRHVPLDGKVPRPKVAAKYPYAVVADEWSDGRPFVTAVSATPPATAKGRLAATLDAVAEVVAHRRRLQAEAEKGNEYYVNRLRHAAVVMDRLVASHGG